MPSFDLTTRSWIPVLMRDGTSRELSLLDAIALAPDVACITGNPLEAAVLHRLLLAIAHRSDSPEDPGEWLQLWRNRTDVLRRMADYVKGQTALFDLYGGPRPFAQHPGLPAPNRTPAEIVYDLARGNNPVFLEGSVVGDPKPLPSAIAARAVLVTHAFGGSGTGGMNPLNGNKKDTMYAGPLCARMIAILEGRNLAETILLNLSVGMKSGIPAWERPLEDTPKQTRSQGLCDLYTRTTRNVLLAPSDDGENCVSVAVVMGNGVLAEDGSTDDPLVPLYLAKDKKFKALRLSPDKSLWRNAQVLLVPSAAETTKPLASIALVNLLVNRGELSDHSSLRVRTLGVTANAQGPVTDMWRDEALPFGLGLFSSASRYQDLVGAVDTAETEAASLRRQLFLFASRYVADGGTSLDPKDASRLLDEICPDLREYWMEIAPGGERIAINPLAEVEWQKKVRDARQTTFKVAVERLAPDARRLRAQFAKEPSPSKRGKTSDS